MRIARESSLKQKFRRTAKSHDFKKLIIQYFHPMVMNVYMQNLPVIRPDIQKLFSFLAFCNCSILDLLFPSPFPFLRY